MTGTRTSIPGMVVLASLNSSVGHHSGAVNACLFFADPHTNIDQFDVYLQVMAVTLFVLFMKRRFDVLQTRPWQVERMALALVTDIDAEIYFYIVIVAIETVIASEARQSQEATQLPEGDCFVPRNDGFFIRVSSATA